MNIANIHHQHLETGHLQKRLKTEARSPPPITPYPPMCQPSVMPLPPPLTFNSTKLKKTRAVVSPVNGVGSSPVQSCPVQPQQRGTNKETPCKHSEEMLNKLENISRDLLTLKELVREVQKQHSLLSLQLNETNEKVQRNADEIRGCTATFKAHMSTLLKGQVDQTEFIKTTSTKFDDQIQQCKKDVGDCENVCRNLVKQNEGFTEMLHVIKDAVLQTAKNTSSVVQEAASSNAADRIVPHLSHDPPVQQQQQQQQQQQPQQSQTTITQLQSGQAVQAMYQPFQQVQAAKPANTMIQLGDNNKYYCINTNGVQQPLQMLSVPQQLIQGIQGNLVQIVGPVNSVQQAQQQANQQQHKTKPKHTEIRPKQSTPKKDDFTYGSTSSPQTTNILEEASKVLSNPTLESDGDNTYTIYHSSANEKDALAEAINAIPTTFSQHLNHSNFSDHSLGGEDEPGALHTSEMLSKAINVVEGDHNLYFDKVMIGNERGGNGSGGSRNTEKDLQVPAYLPDEVINCVYRKSKEPSNFALNICREIISREEFISDDFKSFVSKNPLRYKYIENHLTTKFGLYGDNLQSILKDLRIKFNNYHRHVKRSVRLKEQAKQERQLDQMMLHRTNNSEGEKMLDLLKQEPASLDDHSSFG